MNVIEATRNLGKEIQKDERFIAFAKAKLALDKDDALNGKIGEFNIIRMNLDRLIEQEEKDNEKIAEANKNLRAVYDEIMANPTMTEYNESRAQVDKMIADVMGIIRMCAEGADPETCELPEAGCSGSCSTCSGCH